MPSHRLLESHFLWILTEKSAVIRPPGVQLEGDPAVLQEPYLNSTLSFASWFCLIARYLAIPEKHEAIVKFVRLSYSAIGCLARAHH